MEGGRGGGGEEVLGEGKERDTSVGRGGRR